MFNLLSWLYDQAGRVYALFGYLYERVRDAALYAYSWARDAANDAYQWARNTTLYYYERAKDRIAEAIQTARNTTILYYNIVRSWIDETATSIRSSILYWYNRARDGAEALVQGVADLAVALFNEATKNANDIANAGFALFQAIADRIAYEINQRIDKTETAIAEIKTMLNAETAEGIDNLVTIFSNPLGWIFSLLYDRFIEFLCDQLARGLGTVKAELPSSPTFGIAAVGGPYTGPIPESGGILGSPLSSLRISGYTFNNPPGHYGVDLGLVRGTRIFAMHNGVVVSAGWSDVGYGFNVVIQSREWWSRYAHLDNIQVSVGDEVSRRQPIGWGNSTGNSTGDHLHLELKRFGQWIDPLSVL